jgi:hypothetical protein
MTITVQFTGICTHVSMFPGDRVVLVRADNGAFINDKSIPPHIARLRIDPANIVRIEGYPYGLESTPQEGVWHLRGVAWKLEGVAADGFTRDASCGKVPRLSDLTSELPGLLPGVHEQVSAYFDIHSGHLSSTTIQQGAIISALEARTTTTEEPALRVTCLWNRKSSRIVLQKGTIVHLEHVGLDQDDAEYDFLLHYLIFGAVPNNAGVPKSDKLLRAERIPGNISVGCSNSQYP